MISKYSGKNAVVFFWASFGYTGSIPILAGTIGSLEGGLVSLIFNSNPVLKGLVLGILFITGIFLATLVENLSGKKDDRRIVIDEVAGGMVSTFFLPGGLWPWLVSLVSFRLLDWSKPFPIRRLEKLNGGAGVMADDLLAGLYSLGLTWVIYLLRR